MVDECQAVALRKALDRLRTMATLEYPWLRLKLHACEMVHTLSTVIRASHSALSAAVAKSFFARRHATLIHAKNHDRHS